MPIEATTEMPATPTRKMPPAATAASSRPFGRLLAEIALALLLAGITIFLSFHSGGFFAGATSLAAAETAVAIVLLLVLARRPFEGLSIPLAVAVVSMGGLAAWTLLSADWSDSMARALPEYTRALLYALTLLLFGLLPFDARRVRWMVYGLAAAIFAVCVTSVIARTLPHVIFDSALAGKEDRLGYPLTYWNTLGLLAGVGIVLCGHLACSSRDPRPVRVLGAAAVPLLTLVLYYTLSRGGTWAAVVGVVIYVLVGRPRALLSGAIATVPATLIILLVANPPNALTDGNPAGPTAVASGKHIVIVLVVCMLGAALVRAALLPVDRRMAGLRLPDRARRPVLVGIVVAAGVLALAGSVAVGLPGTVKDKYEEFANPSDASPSGGGDRLLSASTNGRKEHWDVALAAFRRDRLHGSGAGTFSLLWAKERSGTVHVEDAHSLYIETLGELGLVGFVLLVVALALILGAFVYRARGPDRAMFAAVLAAGLGWALASGVDWDWEMPAVTLWLFAFGGAALARSPRARSESRSRIWGAAARAVGVVACVALAVTPARVAIAAGRFESALSDFRSGDCAKAKREARISLSAEGERMGPYALIAFCDVREGSYRAALRAAKAAHARDPRNWETYYGLAVARAAAGRDPRTAAKRAAILNPNDPLAGKAPAVFGGHDRRAWVAAGRSAVLLPPTADDP